MPSKYAYVDGIAVNYFHTGTTTLPAAPPRLDRPPVILFVHGFGSNGHAWRRQLEHFEASHSAIAFDFPGHGRSGNAEGLTSIGACADFTEALCRVIGIPPCVLVGHSMGAAAAMEMAIARRERVSALVLVAAAARFEIGAERLQTWRNVMWGRAPQPFTTEAFSPKTDFAVMRDAWMEQVKTDPRVRYHDLVASDSFDFADRLGEIEQPTLIIAGRDDAIVPLAAAENLHGGIRGSRLVVIDDAGNTVASEKPAEFNAAVEEFLRALPG